MANRPDGRVIIRESSEVDDHMVAQLIENREWNLRPIMDVIDVIDEDTAASIRKIPLLPNWTQDKLVWKGNKNGDYSVRTAYRLQGSNK